MTDDGIGALSKSLKLRALSKGTGSHVVNSHPQTAGTYSEPSDFVTFTRIQQGKYVYNTHYSFH